MDWVNAHRLKAAVVTGICTDVCVMDFVLTMLSARNHGMMPTLEDVVVMEPATATYHLPREVVRSLGLPETAAHPKPATHHMGLYFMASRGAVLATRMMGLWVLDEETATGSERQPEAGKPRPREVVPPETTRQVPVPAAVSVAIRHPADLSTESVEYMPAAL